MDDIQNKIADFVESIHLDDRRSVGASGEGSPVPVTGQHITEEEEELSAEARKKVERSVLDAEKHKAMVAEPPGEMLSNLINPEQQGLVNSQNYGNILIPEQGQVRFHGKGTQVIGMDGGLTDDDFFHLMCHVDSALISKIEKGEFVDLDKLIPKEKMAL